VDVGLGDTHERQWTPRVDLAVPQVDMAAPGWTPGSHSWGGCPRGRRGEPRADVGPLERTQRSHG